MNLTAEEKATALTTLNAAGIAGKDATTSLATLEHLSTEADLHAWVDNHTGDTPPALAAQYGHDATRAAAALITRPHAHGNASQPHTTNQPTP